MKIERTEGSETSAYKIQTPGNHPKESIQRVKLVTHQALVCLSQIAKESEVICLQIPSAFSEEILCGVADGFLDVIERTLL